MPPVTRFAPSPTGYLHIGGARTALFSWLYARGRGGKFLLRIEDTDRARHNEAAVAAIIDGLTWLGLDWDAPPVSQYERRHRHAEVARDLLARGAAYPCFMTADETEVLRNESREKKIRFESPWRTADPAARPTDKPYAIRFRAPQAGETLVRDVVQGDVRFPNDALDDLVILRSPDAAGETAPTYNLAVVVDDHDMGVTHVIRGDDHLSNAARQQQIYEAMGWTVPSWSHVPLIHGQDGAKLSKRHGALGVEAYRDDGFLPEGLCNYLLRLGWSHGDEEIIPRARALQIFDVTGINKAPARLDLDKLRSVNAHYLHALSDAEFVRRATPFLEAAGRRLHEDAAARLGRGAPFVRSRSATFKDAVAASEFLFLNRPIAVSGKAAKPLEPTGARPRLGRVAALLSERGIWNDASALEDLLKTFAQTEQVGFNEVGPALRAVLTGGAPSPSLGEVLYALGEDEALARICDHVA